MIYELIFLIIGFAGLWFGADLLIRGSKNICEYCKIPHFLMGLAFISIGTSLPEIAISLVGGVNKLIGFETSGIVIGNKIGSALSEVTLLLGLLVFLVPLKKFNRKVLIRQGVFLVSSVLLVFLLALDGYLSRTDGVLAILAYAGYYIFIWFAHHGKKKILYMHKKIKRRIECHIAKDMFFVVIGLILLLYTADIVIKNGINIASSLGVSESLIGILLIGLGTGRPELSVLIASVRRKAIGISLGDLIGSTICDILLALGVGVVISGFLVDKINILFDFPALLVFCGLALFFFYKKRSIGKKEGVILMVLFLLYALIKIFVTG